MHPSVDRMGRLDLMATLLDHTVVFKRSILLNYT